MLQRYPPLQWMNIRRVTMNKPD